MSGAAAGRGGGPVIPGRSRLGLVGVVVLLVAALPALVHAQVTIQSKEPTDPQARQIKAGLERRGMKVYDVVIRRAQGRDPAIWGAVTAALYGAPTTADVMNQAANTWDVMHSVLTQEPAATVLIAAQVWTRYILNFAVTKQEWADFLQAWNAARSDDQKKAAAERLIKAMSFSVWDVENRRWADRKDFVNKHFAD